MDKCIFAKFVLYKIGSYCDIYTCSNLLRTCKSLYYEFHHKIPEIHNEFEYINVNLYEILKSLEKEQEMYYYISSQEMYYNILRNKMKFYKFKPHRNDYHFDNIIVPINDIKTLKFEVLDLILNESGFFNPKLLKDLITTFIFNWLDGIMILNKKKLMNLHSIIFTGQFKKIIICNDTREHDNMEDLLIDLRYTGENKKYVDTKRLSKRLIYGIPLGILAISILGYYYHKFANRRNK